MIPRYPIYVISKGRAENPMTARFLARDKVPFKMVIEPQEQAEYALAVGMENLLILPFANLGLGSIPARNWVWEHAKANGADRHWILDDNIRQVWRRYRGVKLPCAAGPALAATEDFSDRYENVALAGMNYYMFVPNNVKVRPFVRNVHVYSAILIRNDLPQRWRGRYNEDTDLCLQVLSAGFCTVLMNAFMIEKTVTMTMKGGNSDELYQGDGRLRMARNLERLWPGVVETKRRFGRPQHVIKKSWAGFDTPLKLKQGIDLSTLPANEYGMTLRAVKPVKSARLRAFLPESEEGNK